MVCAQKAPSPREDEALLVRCLLGYLRNSIRASKPTTSAGMKLMVGILSNKAGDTTTAKAMVKLRMGFIFLEV